MNEFNIHVFRSDWCRPFGAGVGTCLLGTILSGHLIGIDDFHCLTAWSRFCPCSGGRQSVLPGSARSSLWVWWLTSFGIYCDAVVRGRGKHFALSFLQQPPVWSWKAPHFSSTRAEFLLLVFVVPPFASFQLSIVGASFQAPRWTAKSSWQCSGGTNSLWTVWHFLAKLDVKTLFFKEHAISFGQSVCLSVRPSASTEKGAGEEDISHPWNTLQRCPFWAMLQLVVSLNFSLRFSWLGGSGEGRNLENSVLWWPERGTFHGEEQSQRLKDVDEMTIEHETCDSKDPCNASESAFFGRHACACLHRGSSVLTEMVAKSSKVFCGWNLSNSIWRKTWIQDFDVLQPISA